MCRLVKHLFQTIVPMCRPRIFLFGGAMLSGILPLYAEKDPEIDLLRSRFIDQFDEILQMESMVNSRIFSERIQALWREFQTEIPMERALLKSLFQHYLDRNQRMAAIAVLQELARRHVDDPERQQWYFQLGQLYREAGAFETAIARFYQVLNPSVVRSGAPTEEYRRLSQRAQFEIARSYFEMGDHERSTQLFSRLELIELSDADRETVAYYNVRSHYQRRQYNRVIALAENFREQYTASRREAEILYMQTRALEATGARDQALVVTLELLRSSQPGSANGAEQWQHWQRTTGNFFANHYFERGDLNAALQIYQAMARLSDSPEWLWPIVYQIGICTERLGLMPRAREAYEWILAEADSTEIESASIRMQTDMIVEGATWRLERLDRLEELDQRIQQLSSSITQ
ncbi:MAG: tetratricopeptide repeat protein [Opitutales bacterium]|nr:tetratricopeptide repeat protein [Opitutales bacterium]